VPPQVCDSTRTTPLRTRATTSASDGVAFVDVLELVVEADLFEPQPDATTTTAMSAATVVARPGHFEK
jgi:hypothetical protein